MAHKYTYDELVTVNNDELRLLSYFMQHPQLISLETLVDIIEDSQIGITERLYMIFLVSFEKGLNYFTNEQINRVMSTDHATLMFGLQSKFPDL